MRQDIDIHVLRVLLALALAGLGLIGVAMARIEAQPRPVWTPPPPNFELRLSADGRALHFSGVVDFGLTEALRGLVAEHPEIRRVVLDSQGGYVAEARGAVSVLRAHGLDTHVEGDCASACVLIFAGGRSRTLAQTARLGLHGYRLRAGQHLGMIDPVAEMQRDLAIFRAQSVSESFVAKLSALPQYPMWYPDHAELRAAGVITANPVYRGRAP